MIIRIAWPLFMTAVLSLVLSACGGDSQDVTPHQGSASLYFSYPYDGQKNVSTQAPMVLRLSDPVLDDEADLEEQVRLLAGEDEVEINVTLPPDTGDRSVLIRPVEPLAHNREYRLEVTGLQTGRGMIQLDSEDLAFSTRPAELGPRALRTGGDEMELVRMIPDGTELPVMDFSALRFEFSQPLDRQTLTYGETVKLTSPDGALVEAELLAAGRFLTVDPRDELAPGETHEVEFGPGILSVFEESLQAPFDDGFSVDITPLDSTPRESMALNAPPGGEVSVLTGETINVVPVIATLLGGEEGSPRSQQGGDLAAELAFVPNFPEKTPMRVPAGTRLTGEALDIMIGGEIPAGIDSGDLTVELVSDASGYLLPNRFSNASDAPRELRLFMDIAASTGEPEANAGFTQDVLHLEVVGQAIVEDGVLRGDGISVVETNVLGVETSYGTLGFHMQSYPDQRNAPEPIIDINPPMVHSWLPGDGNGDRQRPGDPIIVNFNEKVRPSTLEENLQVRADGAPVEDFQFRQEGAALVINTELEYGVTYDVELGSGITDLAGNPFGGRTLTFEMPEFGEGPLAAPLAVNAYPGYPCVKDRPAGSLDELHTVGQCRGGLESDDFLPIPDMPANRDIRINFTQVMDEDSLRNGGFHVEKIDEFGVPQEIVEGEIETRARELRFMPHEPWEEGQLYRYVLASNGDHQSSEGCDGAQEIICSAAGLPLQTLPLAEDPEDAPALDGGGPDMEIIFRGAEPSDATFVQFNNVPTEDVNSNALVDTPEGHPIDEEDFLFNSIRSEVTHTDGMVEDANIGCAPPEEEEEDCPENKFAHLTAGLNVDITQYFTAEEAQQALDEGEVSSLPEEVEQGGGMLFYIYPTVLRASQLVAYSETGLPGFSAEPAATGPMVMRLRHQCDARPDEAAPEPPNAEPLPRCEPGVDDGRIEAWIVEGDDGRPLILSTFNSYLDAPALDPKFELDLDLLSDVPLLGDILGDLSGIVIDELVAAEHNVRSQGLDAAARGPGDISERGTVDIAAVNESRVDAQLNIRVREELLDGAVVDALLAGLGVDVLEAEIQLSIHEGDLNLLFITEPPRH